MKKFKRFVLLSGMLLLAACGQAANEADSPDEQLQIVTSFYPVYAFTEAVAGDSANVELMITGSQDSHSYEPSARDIARLEAADVFVYSSDEMETWVPQTISSLASDSLSVVEAAGEIELISAEVVSIDGADHEGETAEEHAEHAHDVDPHTWLDPVLAQTQVQEILTALVAADPANAEAYERNAAAFTAELETLDQEFSAAFADKGNRTFLTQHAAFAYLANRYDLEQVAVTGVSSAEEPSPQRLATLTEYIDQNDVKVMYMQAGVSDNISATLAAETGVEISTLNSLEVGDKAISDASDGYLAMMRANLENLKLAIK